ncbi:TetR/AcrR family transcriptional regulator [Isoalcanivorax beigongshangi]|uniref:TetR/AcrR family transcriptional regulator n=1 Tax=Isoalcanivorax beigongshangi TaxID=3238810 RepID=A0ABV4AHC4_9GAMM
MNVRLQNPRQGSFSFDLEHGAEPDPMRYDDTHKQHTRQRLLQASAAVLKAQGFSATGVDRLMQAAGLSGGALYAYYPSKNALLAAVVENEVLSGHSRLTPERGSVTESLRHLLRQYLSLSHVQHPELGCLLPALAAELSRAPQDVQALLDRANELFVAHWAPRLGSRTDAQFLITQLVGSVLLARMSNDPERQREILNASKQKLTDMFLAPGRLPEPV